MDLPASASDTEIPDTQKTIEVTVEFFGVWRDLAGSRGLLVTLPIGCTVTDLVAHLSSRYGQNLQEWLVNPATGELWSSFAVGINDSLIDRAGEMFQELHAGDRVFFFHPVVGGV
jgi:molybdopterin converting factor small subunit